MLERVKIMDANDVAGYKEAVENSSIAFLVFNASEAEKFRFNTPYMIRNLAELIALGIKEENSPLLFRNIEELYTESGSDMEVWVMGVAENNEPEDVFDEDNPEGVRSLLEASDEKVNLLIILNENKQTQVAGEENLFLDDIYDRIENIQIGKTNLLQGTYDGYEWGNASQTGKSILSVEKGIFNYSNTSQNEDYFYPSPIPLIQGTEYTLSFWYKTEGESKENFDFLEINGEFDPATAVKSTFENQEEWTFHKFTFTSGNEWQDKTIFIMFYNTGRSSDENCHTLFLKGIKLEKGNVASDWDFSPDDIMRFCRIGSDRIERINERLTPNKNLLAGTGRRCIIEGNGMNKQVFPLYSLEQGYSLADVIKNKSAFLSFDIEVEGNVNDNSVIEIFTTHTATVLVEGFKPISGKEHKVQNFILQNFEDDNSLSLRLSYIPENTIVTISNMKLEQSVYETIYSANDMDPVHLPGNYTSGRNLLSNHTFQEGLQEWTVSAGVEATVTDDDLTPTGKAIHIISSTDNLSGITQEFPYEVGKTYSITVYAKGETEGQRLRIVGANCQAIVVSLSKIYQPYTFTFTKEEGSGDTIRFQKYAAEDAPIWISSPVLVEGRIPSPWYVADIYDKFYNINDSIDVSVFVVQETEPEDKSVLWIKNSEPSIPTLENEDLLGLYEAIRELTTYYNEVIRFAFNKVMSPGDFNNNAVNDMKKGVEAAPPAGMPEFLQAVQALNSAEEEWDPEYPEWTEDFLPNLKHITIKAGKKSDLETNFGDFIDNELLWAKDTRQLYIKNNGQPVLLNSGSGGSGNLDYDALDRLDTIGFISEKGQTYRIKVNNNGELVVYRKDLDYNQSEPTGIQTDPNTGWEYTTVLYLPKLYINSLYCGGINEDEYSYNPCSHNFVELSNLTNSNISLQGLSLQYCGEGTQWEVLPLHGEIKAGSTFLIRGAQCSVMNTNTTRIKVEEYDMEWYASDGKLIRFDNTKGKFYLTWGTTRSILANPYNKTTDTLRVSKGYIDLVGLQVENAGDADRVDASEGTPYTYMNNKRLFTKYYAMDPVSQATKALTARNNANDWYFVNLEADAIPNVEAYTPKASFRNKDIFYNKSRLAETKPCLITVAFGIQATAPNATRCFNWTSVGYYDEYVFLRIKGTEEWAQTESFKKETGVRKYYNRIRMIATDGTSFTTHKAIIKNLQAGKYEYYIGRKGDDSYKSDIFEFEIKNSADVINEGYRFVQVSDQQGFNWDEYQVWKISAQYIQKNEGELDFLINTGDMTQNGNRINEWIDYDNARLPLANLAQMVTIGNNDLTPANVYILGDGGDNSKINATNMQFFYTYEIDEENPPVFTIEGKEIFVESLYSFNYGNTHFLCVNSEISAETETRVYGLSRGQRIYDSIKKWCESDMEKLDDSIKWKIAYCHEMPFTIITQDLINSFYWRGTEYPTIERSGSRLNFNTSTANRYWFSRFVEEHGFRLVLGGHKHTYTCSYPLKENVSENTIKSMKPIIQVTPEILKQDFNCEELYTETGGDLAGQSFPISWQGQTAYDTQRHLCTFELVDTITAPIYLMSQATGYKHTSNKELPTPATPWLRYFYPAEITIHSQTSVEAKVNTGQQYPFYILFDVSENGINATVKRISNVFAPGGKYNVNIISSTQSPVAIPGNGEKNNGNDIITIK